MNSFFQSKNTIFVLSILTLTLVACGGGGGEKAKTFASLNDVQGSYRPSSAFCKGDEVLDAAFEADVLARASNDGDVLTLTTSSMSGKFPMDEIKCSAVVKVTFVKATSSEISWNDLKVSYEGAECNKIPEEGKKLMAVVASKAPKTGSMKIRYSPKVFMTIDKKDGGCDVFARIQ